MDLFDMGAPPRLGPPGISERDPKGEGLPKADPPPWGFSWPHNRAEQRSFKKFL
jgi:hypothetical protein